MNFPIRYEKHIDLIFHGFAHMKVNNASNLYSGDYIKKIQSEKEKTQFPNCIEKNMEKLSEYYNTNFERLMPIGFISFFTDSLHDFQNALFQNRQFAPDDIFCFINPFIELLNEESQFYNPYWDSLQENLYSERQAVEQMLHAKMNPYACIFQYYKKTPEIFLSHSITQYGRGIYSDVLFRAAVPFPVSVLRYDDCFFTALHEMTHQFTDNLLGTNISMRDHTHNLSENVAILADFYLIRTLDSESEHATSYLRFIERLFHLDKQPDESDLLRLFPLPPELELELKQMVYALSNTVQ